jgi:hypothetical protein
MPEDELLGTMDMGKRSSGDMFYGRDAVLGNNVAFNKCRDSINHYKRGIQVRSI